MNFLHPAFLGAGLAIGLPILLHLLRRKPTRSIPFPTLRFLGPILLKESKRQKILRWLVLAMRCLVLLLLATAFSRPFFAEKPSENGKAVVVVIDNSFSMQSGKRWETLRQWALDQTSHLKKGDQLGLLLMHPAPTWLTPPGPDVENARSLLKNLTPGWETTRYPPALRLAAETLRMLPARQREIVWLADEQWLGWREMNFQEPLPANVTLTSPPTQPQPTKQAALTKLDVRQSKEGVTLEVSSQSFTPESQNRTVTIYANDELLTTAPITITPGKPVVQRFPVKAHHGTTRFRAELDKDDLPADDIIYAVHTQEMGMQVSLFPVSAPSDTDYLVQALEAAKGEDLEPVRVQIALEEPVSKNSVLVVRGSKAFSTPDSGNTLTKWIQQGGAAWILVDGSEQQVNWLRSHGVDVSPMRALTKQRLKNLDIEHPIIAPFAESRIGPLLSVDFHKGWQLNGPSLLPIADWTHGGHALAEQRIGSGLLLISGFDFHPEQNSMPLSPMFLPFAHQAVLWLARRDQNTERWFVGDSIPLSTVEGIWSSVDSPVSTEPRPTRDAITPSAPGIYQFQIGSEIRFFAVHVRNEESDLQPYPDLKTLLAWQQERPVESNKANTALPAPQLLGESTEHQSPLWWWLIFFAVIILLAELQLANRTAL